MNKPKVYLVSDMPEYTEGLVYTQGRILKEDGTVLGSHISSDYRWLLTDLLLKLDNIADYDIVNLIGKKVPARFQINNSNYLEMKNE